MQRAAAGVFFTTNLKSKGDFTPCGDALARGLSDLADRAFPSLPTARACLNAALAADAEERAVEDLSVDAMRRLGLCLQDVTGYLYPRRAEDALYDPQ